jgi:sulfur carrier protein
VELTINGTTKQVEGVQTLSDLIRMLGLSPKGVAVAVNETVVPRSLWDSAMLRAGDTIEVIRAVQGG